MSGLARAHFPDTPETAGVFAAMEGQKRRFKDGRVGFVPSGHNLGLVTMAFPALIVEMPPPEPGHMPAAAPRSTPQPGFPSPGVTTPPAHTNGALDPSHRDKGSVVADPAPFDWSGYTPSVPPMAHQLDALARFGDARVCALFHDPGCVDSETEYLSPSGWVKISDYRGGAIAQFDPFTKGATFVEPIRYIKRPCSEFYRFKSSTSCDQWLTGDHRVLAVYFHRPKRRTTTDGWCEYITPFEGESWFVETTPEKLESINSGRVTKFKPAFSAWFHMDGAGIGLTDAQLRLQVAVIADGSYGSRHTDVPKTVGRLVVVSLKRQRKIARLVQLLDAADVSYKRKDREDGYSIFRFVPPRAEKHFISSEWWNCSYEQKRIIADECIHWDGSAGVGNRCGNFHSSRKEDADFVQFCFSSTGQKARLSSYDTGMHVVMPSKERIVSLVSAGKVEATDGFAYCFTVPSGFLVLRRNGCVFTTGNCGKTFTALTKAGRHFLRGEITGLLVVTVTGVHAQWIDQQVPEHLAVPHFAQARGKRPLPAALFTPGNGLRVLAMGYDALATASGKADALRFIRGHGGRVLMVCDESHLIKSPGSARHKAARAVGAVASHRMLLTGTPVAKALEDEWSQLAFLDENITGIRYLTTFRAQFAVMGGFEGRSVVGHRNLDRYLELTAPYVHRVRKEDVLDLPDKVYSRYQFDLTPEQTRHYKELKREFITKIADGSVSTVANAAVLVTRLQQLASGLLVNEAGVHVRLPNSRVQALVSCIQAMPPGSKVLIWARFTHEIEDIGHALGAAGLGAPEMLHGGIAQSERPEAVARFLDPAGSRFLVANQAAGGTGYNLQGACTHVVYYSNSYNYVHRRQSEDRVHRIGTKDTIYYTDLVARGTGDAMILANLKGKHALSERLHGPTMDELRAVLLAA